MDHRIHYLSSLERTSGDSSNFTCKIKVPTNHDVVSLVSASIPKSWYNIPDTTENYFYIDSTRYELAIGNYSIEDFLEAVNLLISPHSMNLNSRTAKFDFETLTATALICPTNSRINQLFGFSQGSTNAFSGGLLSSSRIVNFQSVNTIYVVSDIVWDMSYNFSGCLYSLPVNNTSDLSYYTFLNTNIEQTAKHLKIPTANTDIEVEMRVTILDEEDRVINLNGVDLNLSIRTWKHQDYTQELLKVQKSIRDLMVSKEKYNLAIKE